MFAHVHEYWPMIEVPLNQCILHRGMCRANRAAAAGILCGAAADDKILSL